MTVISFRAEDERNEKLRRIADKTGRSVSQVIRDMIDAVDVASITTFKPVIKNAGAIWDGSTDKG